MPANRDVASCSGTAITSNVTAASTSACTHDRRYPRKEEKTTNGRPTRPARYLTLPNTAAHHRRSTQPPDPAALQLSPFQPPRDQEPRVAHRSRTTTAFASTQAMSKVSGVARDTETPQPVISTVRSHRRATSKQSAVESVPATSSKAPTGSENSATSSIARSDRSCGTQVLRLTRSDQAKPLDRSQPSVPSRWRRNRDDGREDRRPMILHPPIHNT